jgi:hypothetical protein
MQTKIKFMIFIGLVVVIVGGLGIYFGTKPQKPGELDDFAKCINDSGAKFYNAFGVIIVKVRKKCLVLLLNIYQVLNALLWMVKVK